MSFITQCPQCNTRFKVSQEQLDAHHGMVRCGRCQAVFDAVKHLYDDEPSPQLALPIEQEKAVPVEGASQDKPAVETHKKPDLSYMDQSHAGNLPKNESAKEGAASVTLAQQIASMKPLVEAVPEPAEKKRRWPWVIGCLLLLMVLLAQAAYFFRIELAARLPGIKPTLISYCLLLRCTVPLPQKADQLSIESSDLEVADPAQASTIILNATLRNHAPYAQTYPNLELTLTDTQDKAVARRAFRPMEYLRPDEDEKQGLLPNRETSIKLHLDTTDLKPTGYRLFLFYPQ